MTFEEKVKMHFMFHDKKLGYKEIATEFGITAVEVMAEINKTDSMKAEHKERVRTRFSEKNRINGCWVVKSGQLQRYKTK